MTSFANILYNYDNLLDYGSQLQAVLVQRDTHTIKYSYAYGIYIKVHSHSQDCKWRWKFKSAYGMKGFLNLFVHVRTVGYFVVDCNRDASWASRLAGNK